MKNKTPIIALAGFLAVLSALTVQADEDLRNESQQAIANFLKTDSALQRFLADSAGYAVFPNVGKGGFIVGGARGKGMVYEKGNVVGQATMTQASIGAQIGGQTFAEIIFFETPVALNDFKSGKFEMSAEASAVAAAEGASKTADYKQGVAVFTLPKKGLMVQASVGGQKFKFEPEALQPTGRTTPAQSESLQPTGSPAGKSQPANPEAKPSDAASNPLGDAEWRLVELNGKPIQRPEGATPLALRFDAEKKAVSGSTGINHIIGSYELEGAKLKLGELATTRMAGPPELMKEETEFLDALKTADSWKRTGDRLELLSGDKVIAALALRTP